MKFKIKTHKYLSDNLFGLSVFVRRGVSAVVFLFGFNYTTRDLMIFFGEE